MSPRTISHSELMQYADVAKDKVVVITGGAGGVGRRVAIEFAIAGAKVVVGDINDSATPSIVQEIKTRGGDGVFLKTDVSIWEEQLALFELAVQTYRHVDIVLPLAQVHSDSAGFEVFRENANAPLEPDLGSLNVNHIGAIYSSKLALHYLLRSRSPQRSIVLLALSAPTGGLELGPTLSGAAHGNIGLFRSLHSTVPSGTRLCLVAPAHGSGKIDPALVASTIFLAATDPEHKTHSSVYTVPAASTVDQPVTVSRMPLTAVDVLTVGMYAQMNTRFRYLLAVRGFLKWIVVRIYGLFGQT